MMAMMKGLAGAVVANEVDVLVLKPVKKGVIGKTSWMFLRSYFLAVVRQA